MSTIDWLPCRWNRDNKLSTHRFSLVLRADGAVTSMSDEIYHFADWVTTALWSRSGPRTLLLAFFMRVLVVFVVLVVLVVLVFLVVFVVFVMMMILLRVDIRRAASVWTPVQRMLRRKWTWNINQYVWNMIDNDKLRRKIKIKCT